MLNRKVLTMSDATIEEIDVEDKVDIVSPAGARILRAANVVPIHDATGSHSRTRRGRPKPIVKNGQKVDKPTVDDLEYLARIQHAQVQFVEQDELVRAVTTGNASSIDVLKLLRIKAARDAAALEFQRVEAEKRGQETAQTISRHTKVLRDVAGLESEIRNLAQSTLDLKSEQFQKVFHLWIENVSTVVREVMTPEQADLFFNKLSTVMGDWEDRASEVIR